MSNLYVRFAIMVIAAIGALFGWSNTKKGAEWGQPVTILCALIAIVAALWGVVRQFSNSDAKEAIGREAAYQQAMTEKLAQYICQNYAGKKIVVIYGPRVDIEKDNGFIGLSRGLDNGGAQWEKVMIPPPPGTTIETPLEPVEFWYTEKKFDETVASCSDVDLFISFNGLPINAKCDKNGKFTKPSKVGNAKFVLASYSDLKKYKAYIKNKGIVAAVSFKPDGVFDENPCPKQLDEAFDKRYMIITPDNLDELASKYSDIFN